MTILPAYFNERIRPEGIEPPSQEPESYVISITLRTDNEFGTKLVPNSFILVLGTYGAVVEWALMR